MSRTSMTFENLPLEKQDRIIRAATEEFGKKGYQGASINAIVRKLNIAKGSIFNYFGNKSGLFLYIFDITLKRVKEELKGVMSNSRGLPIEKRLQLILETGVDFVKRHPVLFKLYLRLLYDSDIPMQKKLVVALRKKSIDFLASLIHDAMENNELKRDVNPKIAAFITDAVMDRFLQAIQIDGIDGGLGFGRADSEKHRRLMSDIISHLIGGLAPYRPERPPGNNKPYPLVMAAAPTRMELDAITTGIPQVITPLSFSELQEESSRLSAGITGVETGVGPVEAACSLARDLLAIKPDLVILFGIAGGFARAGVKAGDIIIATELVSPELGRENPGMLPSPIISEEMGSVTNRIKLDPGLSSKVFDLISADAKILSKNVTVKTGTIVSVATVTTTKQRAGMLFDMYHPVAEDMESYSAALCAGKFGIPIIIIRSISNIVGENGKVQWDISRALSMLHMAASAIFAKTDWLVKFQGIS